MNTKYWLRGGIVMVIIAIAIKIVGISGYGIDSVLTFPGYMGTYAIIGNFGIGCVSDFVGRWANHNPAYCDTLTPILIPIMNIIFYFIIGSLIGWIYGKTVNRKVVGMTQD